MLYTLDFHVANMKNSDEISPPPDKRRKSSPKLDKLQLYPQIKDKSYFQSRS